MHDQSTDKLTCWNVHFTVNSVQARTDFGKGSWTCGAQQWLLLLSVVSLHLSDMCLAWQRVFCLFLVPRLELTLIAIANPQRFGSFTEICYLFLVLPFCPSLPLLLGWSKLVRNQEILSQGPQYFLRRVMRCTEEYPAAKHHVQNAFRHL